MVTFVATPEAVAEAAFQAIAKAAQVIDMSRHHGEHPRMGATDVCPFVPIEGVTMEDCAAIARSVGERVGASWRFPSICTRRPPSRPSARTWPRIREGEYEGLAEKLRDPRWKPDFGPARFNRQLGGHASIGAREFLIAYNVTLNTRDKAAADRHCLRAAREGPRGPGQDRLRPITPAATILFYREGAFPCGNCDFVGRRSTRRARTAARRTTTTCDDLLPPERCRSGEAARRP